MESFSLSVWPGFRFNGDSALPINSLVTLHGLVLFFRQLTFPIYRSLLGRLIGGDAQVTWKKQTKQKD